jgi:hypothetical protein
MRTKGYQRFTISHIDDFGLLAFGGSIQPFVGRGRENSTKRARPAELSGSIVAPRAGGARQRQLPASMSTISTYIRTTASTAAPTPVRLQSSRGSR